MLLTIKQPAHHAYKSFHDYSPPTPPSTSRFSPAITSTGPLFSPTSINNKSLPPLPTTNTITQQMSAPHRGLPPPAAMALPQPLPQPLQQTSSANQPPIGQGFPAPPQQWQGAEDSMRNWLHAKAEEDKRKQEEEKTRQEALRLEQRKIEQDMLRTSLNGGIPPYMIPLIFAGMGGGNLPNASLEWAQHYMTQAHSIHQQHQQLQQQQLLPPQGPSSPGHQRSDSRAIGLPYSASQHPPPITLPSTPIGATSSQHSAGFQANFPMSPATRSRHITQGTVGRTPATSQLPRLNTGDMSAQPMPSGPNPGIQILTGQPNHPLQQTQSAQTQETQASPLIHFHHWQPPATQTVNSVQAVPPTTPSDHTSSPKKRKATGPQQPAPPPSQPQYTSPPFSHEGSSLSNTPSSRRRGHSRQRSDISAQGTSYYGRPPSRHRHTESSFSTHGMASPVLPSASNLSQQRPAEQGKLPAGSHPLSSLLERSDSRSESLQPQSQGQSQQTPRDSPYIAGTERRHEPRRVSPEEEESRRERERAGVNVIRRDDRRD